MPIKQVHKSLVSINKKTLFVELISLSVNRSTYFNYDFDFMFFM